MLNLDRAFELPGLPSVLVIPDDGIEGGHAALARRPRIAMIDGRPELALVVYGTMEHGSFTATGGILSLTTTLELDADEDQAVRAALADQARPPEGGPASPPAPSSVVLLAPDWRSGQAEVEVVAGLRLTGAPSLVGGTRCSFQHKLGAQHARALADDWPGRLEAMTVRYELTLSARPGQLARSEHHRSVSTVSGSCAFTVATGVQVTRNSVASGEQRLVVEGSLDGRGTAMDATMSSIELPGGSPARRRPR